MKIRKYAFAIIAITVLVSNIQASLITVGPGGKFDYETIFEAVDVASNDDEILVAPGTYTCSAFDNETVVRIQRKSILLHSSNGPEITFIDGGGYARGIICNGKNNSTIEGFTIRNCSGNGGGGMVNSHSSPQVINCIFENNQAEQEYYYTASGGGVLNNASSATFEDCIFKNNAAEYSGGAIYNKNFSAVTILNCEFMSNTAYKGGAISNSSLSTATIINSQFSSNFATYYGGAIYLVENCTISCSDCNFTNNYATNSGGSAYSQGGELFVDTCRFDQNSSTIDGGGAIAINGGGATLADSEVRDNSSNFAGGIYILNNFETDVTIGTTTFCGNDGEDILGDWIDKGGNLFYSFCDIGACCTNNLCVLTNLNNCLYVGGEFTSEGVLCGLDTCPTSCIGDLNNDGYVDVTDLLQIVSLWGACP